MPRRLGMTDALLFSRSSYGTSRGVVENIRHNCLTSRVICTGGGRERTGVYAPRRLPYFCKARSEADSPFRSSAAAALKRSDREYGPGRRSLTARIGSYGYPTRSQALPRRPNATPPRAGDAAPARLRGMKNAPTGRSRRARTPLPAPPRGYLRTPRAYSIAPGAGAPCLAADTAPR